MHDPYENYLAKKWAPVLKLDLEEEAFPANVEWYLPRVTMEYDHEGCGDCDVMLSGITPQNMYRQQHEKKNRYLMCEPGLEYDAGLCYEPCRDGWDGVGPACWESEWDWWPDSYWRGVGEEQKLCLHKPWDIATSDSSERFHLDHTSSDMKYGLQDSSQWVAYVHVFPYTRANKWNTSLHVLQYWFFYPYNYYAQPDYPTPTERSWHEGDWEHVTLVLDADCGDSFLVAYYARHLDGEMHDRIDLEWEDATHPVVYVARGTHGAWATADGHWWSVFYDRAYGNGRRWETWNQMQNVGERHSPHTGQEWIRYAGLWGDKMLDGPLPFDGPDGPAFKPHWLHPAKEGWECEDLQCNDPECTNWECHDGLWECHDAQ
jgi:hypothetical protein